jgi:hypothetical protein
MERRSLRRLVGALTLGTLLAALVATCTTLGHRDARALASASAPEGTRIRVQVLNATTTRGLARRATMHLRDRGFDVVELGTAPPQQRLDTTVVLDRSGNAEWAERVARALGNARVESRADSSRYLDVTVLLGRSWRAPAEPFYP